MSNDKDKSSTPFEETVKQELTKAYDTAIDHAIEVMERQRSKFNYDGTNSIINDSISKLQNLKSKQP